MADVKFSEIASGGAFVVATDKVVSVRSGTTDVLSSLGSLAVQNSATVATGGTGITSYSQGDILYATTSTTLSVLAKDASATRYLSNTGATNNPAWAQINVANGVTGTLPVGNGGTGGTTFTSLALLKGNTTGAIQATGISVDDTTNAFYGYKAKINSQTTDYTMTTTDTGKVVEFNVGVAATCTLPNSLGTGFACMVSSIGTAAVTFSAAAGGALHNRSSFTKTAGQYAVMSLYVASNTTGTNASYILGGDGAT